MTTAPAAQTGDVYYDPYDADIDRDPYPTYARLRDQAPIYYNEPHDFCAVSRHADVAKGVADRATFISNRGNILELIKSGIEMPPGLLIYEDPPTHTIHRRFDLIAEFAAEMPMRVIGMLLGIPGARLSPTSTVRGWEQLPLVIP